MLVVKSIAVGLAAAVAASVLWVMAAVVAPLLLMYVRERSRTTGSGGIGVVSGGVFGATILIAAAIGFVAGFVWMLRRG